MERTIKIDFLGHYWAHYKESKVYKILADKYKVEVAKKPDFLILYRELTNKEQKKYKNIIKIAVSLESWFPNLNYVDYTMTLGKLGVGERNFRISFMNHTQGGEYVNTSDLFLKVVKTPPKKELAKRKFCNFVASQDNIGSIARLRKDFTQKLMEYKHVDCPGKILNNMSGGIAPRDAANWQDAKVDFLGDYKFTIAFENQMVDGYWTEKITDAFFARSIPIYFGNPSIGELFNSEAFINGHEYGGDFEKIIERVKEIDGNDELYMKMLNANPIKPNAYFLTEQEELEKYLVNIVENGHVWDKWNFGAPRPFIIRAMRKMVRMPLKFMRII